jgi:hypothetical protein
MFVRRVFCIVPLLWEDGKVLVGSFIVWARIAADAMILFSMLNVHDNWSIKFKE